jgi:hypothetical protein
MPESDVYRKHAEECRQQAARATSELAKATWLKMEQEWFRMAKSAEERDLGWDATRWERKKWGLTLVKDYSNARWWLKCRFGSGRPMATYRAYLLDAGGHITRPPRIFEAADDDAAMRHAQRYVDGCDVEVWDHCRAVALIVSGGLKVGPRTPDSHAYRKLADDCRGEAAKATNPDLKRQYEEMALQYEEMAGGWLAMARALRATG